MTLRTVIYHELDRLCRIHGFDRVAEGFDAIRHSYRPVDFDTPDDEPPGFENDGAALASAGFGTDEDYGG